MSISKDDWKKSQELSVKANDGKTEEAAREAINYGELKTHTKDAMVFLAYLMNYIDKEQHVSFLSHLEN